MTANQKKDGSNSAGTAGGTPKKNKGRPRKPKSEAEDSAE